MKTKPQFILLGCIVGVVAHAADQSAINGKGKPDMDERTLQEKYHIAPTKEGLLGALRHERPEVRTFAALKLATDGQKDAIPAILAAVEVEPLQGAKINLAISAALLGAEDGMNALKNMCGDPSLSPTFRMLAAQGMVGFFGGEFGGEPEPLAQPALHACRASVLDVLRYLGNNPRGDLEGASMALNLLPRFRQIPPTQLPEIRDIGITYLKSEVPLLRMAASQFIRKVGGDSWAVPELRRALSVESDRGVRETIEAELRSLRAQ